MNTKNNQRFLQTEQKLEQTFLSLCQKTLPEKITVSTLCKAVNINRSTFYEHYLDIPDLIQKTGAKYMKDIYQMINPAQNSDKFPFTTDYLIQLFSYIEKHQDFFDIYLNHSNPESLEKGFENLLSIICSPYLSKFNAAPAETLEYHFTFFKAGFIALLRRWILFGCKENPADLAKILLQNLPDESSSIIISQSVTS